MSILEIISVVVTSVSVIVAVWQTKKNADLKRYIRAEAMEAYSDTGILLGSAQTCSKGLQDDDSNIGIQSAGKVEGMAQALFIRSVKNIHHQFIFTRADIDDWVKSNKIHDYHKEAFLKYAEK